jgi:hypothetical protein
MSKAQLKEMLRLQAINRQELRPGDLNSDSGYIQDGGAMMEWTGPGGEFQMNTTPVGNLLGGVADAGAAVINLGHQKASDRRARSAQRKGGKGKGKRTPKPNPGGG